MGGSLLRVDPYASLAALAPLRMTVWGAGALARVDEGRRTALDDAGNMRLLLPNNELL